MPYPVYAPRPLPRSEARPRPVGERAAFLDEIVKGLTRMPKELPSSYLFDGRVSELYAESDRFARAEQAILDAHAGDIAETLGSGVRLVNLTTGDGIRTAQLLARLDAPAQVVLADRSASDATRAARLLWNDHSDVRFVAIDGVAPWDVDFPRLPAAAKSTAIFLGGSVIGELEPRDARARLKRLSVQAGAGGHLVVGIDLKKDARAHVEAYSSPLTVAFARNIATRMNAELGATFDQNTFDYRAVYDAQRGRVELQLVSNRWQWVAVGGHWFNVNAGEPITVMIATKYTIEWFAAVAALAGWKTERVFLDPRRSYALVLLRA